MIAVFDAMARNVAVDPDRLAFACGQERMSRAGLLARVHGLARALAGAPAVVGVALAPGAAYPVADLAVTLTGRRLVPLPHFFSPAQIAHIIADAGVEAVIGAGDFPVPTIAPDANAPGPDIAYQGGASRVIYTSGSTGRPKGVVLGDRQVAASLRGLRAAIAPTEADTYLSVLPQSQLLEQICGIFLPILADAEVIVAPEAGAALFGGSPAPLVAAFARHAPATTLLAPRLLALWVAGLTAMGARAPEGLRFVAVGGAPSSPALLSRALALGIPVREGYGLSEACSVVALNRPEDNAPGTAGRVLDGLTVSIEDGEITVRGPTLMQGYLHGGPAPEVWRTGDLGRIEDGRLVVLGRRDAMIVTPSGRNISPDWVEAVATADPRIACAALVQVEGELILGLAPGAPVDPALIAAAMEALPPYARPAAIQLLDPRAPGLIRPSGAPDRKIARDLILAARAAAKMETAR